MKTAALWNLMSCAILHMVIGRPQQMGKSVVPGTGPAEQVWPPIPYSFQYEVQDAATGNYQNRAEIKTEDGTVRGSYSVLLPDGFIYLTTYNVTGSSGFVYNMVRSLANIPTHRAQSSVNPVPAPVSTNTSPASAKQLIAADSTPEESKTISQQVAEVKASAAKSFSAAKLASTSEQASLSNPEQKLSKNSSALASSVPASKSGASSKSEPKLADVPKQDSTAKSLSEVQPGVESSVSLPFGSRIEQLKQS